MTGTHHFGLSGYGIFSIPIKMRMLMAVILALYLIRSGTELLKEIQT